jgi:hypothetical protein
LSKHAPASAVTRYEIYRLFWAFSHADFELRVEPWRVFYRVHEGTVIVELVGRKKGNVLLIGGKEFEL